MDLDKRAQLQAHVQAIAALLYEETDAEKVQTLAGIEEAVREHMLEYVSPEVAKFLSAQALKLVQDENVPYKASLGNSRSLRNKPNS
ncbi:MAG: hypothetical protein WCA35_01795 [Kovacikia sp.]